MIGNLTEVAGVVQYDVGAHALPQPAQPSPLMEVLLARQSSAEKKLAEAITTTLNLIDPDEALFDIDGERWKRIGNEKEDTKVPYINETGLEEIREFCRALAIDNEYAINAHENRISYVVGSGHSYTATLKPASAMARSIRELDPESDEAQEARDAAAIEVAKVQAVIDDFVRMNKWHKRQQEIVRRKDRDGESVLRKFPDDDGVLRVRFVEPEQIFTPEDKLSDPNVSMGIETVPGDAETPVRYFIDGKPVDAAEIQHRKLGVDANVRRGIPLLFPVRRLLTLIETLQRNMGVVATIQSAIAMIRKHAGASGAAMSALNTANADQTVTNTVTGKTTEFRQYGAGTILDAPAETDYQFPGKDIDPGGYVVVAQFIIRAVAARLLMPEFMLSSDASNANYSSTMVAEGPVVKLFERLQWDMIEDDREILEDAMDVAVEADVLSQELVDQVMVVVVPPRIATRDRDKDIRGDVQLIVADVMSRHTAQLRHDLDPDQEKRLIEMERKRNDDVFERGSMDFPQVKANTIEVPPEDNE